LNSLQLTLLLWLLDQKLAKNVASLLQIVNLFRCKATLLQQTCQSCLFLHGVFRVAGQLGQGAEVILCRAVLQVLGDLLDLGGCLLDVLEAVGRDVLGKQRVNGFDSAGLGVECATRGSVCAGLGVDEVYKGFLASSAVVCLGFRRSLGEEFNSRVACDALILSRSLCILCFGINLGDQDSGFVGEVSRNLLPCWSKRFAICRELN
jgi:hypothetical protein